MEDEPGGGGWRRRSRKKFGEGSIVPRKFRLNGTAPRDRCAIFSRDSARKIQIVWRGIILPRSEFCAVIHVAFHRLRAIAIQPMARLQKIHGRAHPKIDA